MEKYQVIITFDNNDYVQTYFNADSLEEIITHYKRHIAWNIMTEATAARHMELDIKDYEDNSRYTYIYETDKLTKIY